MKIKFVLFTLVLLSHIGFSLAQEIRLKYLGLEGGTRFIGSEISNLEYIRKSMPSHYFGYPNDDIRSFSFGNFVGVNYEIFSLNDRFGLKTGIRYSAMKSSIGKTNYWSSNTDFFYWLYRQEGTDTEYFKINEINQKSDYIGIPIEVRYFTAKRPYLFQFYVKMGVELNYLLKSKTNIVFNNSAMDVFEQEVATVLKKPKDFNATLYAGVGFKLGRDQKPSISIETNMPYIFLTPEAAGLVKPFFGSGFQVNFQIPLK